MYAEVILYCSIYLIIFNLSNIQFQPEEKCSSYSCWLLSILRVLNVRDLQTWQMSKKIRFRRNFWTSTLQKGRPVHGLISSRSKLRWKKSAKMTFIIYQINWIPFKTSWLHNIHMFFKAKNHKQIWKDLNYMIPDSSNKSCITYIMLYIYDNTYTKYTQNVHKYLNQHLPRGAN